MGERLVDCAAVAGDEVPDVGERLGRERHAGAHERRPLHRGLPDERAGPDLPVALPDEVGVLEGGRRRRRRERAIGDAGLGLDHPLRVENGRERLVLDLDRLESVLRDVAVPCDDDSTGSPTQRAVS